jgi:hypothetical protein
MSENIELEQPRWLSTNQSYYDFFEIILAFIGILTKATTGTGT